MTQSVDGWVYQRRAPRLFASHQYSLTFRKRIGVRNVADARQVAAKLDRLVDALVFAAQEFHGPMMDMKDIAASLDEKVLAFMLDKMDAAFRASVDTLLDTGFNDPAQESAVIVNCLDRFRADMKAFAGSSFVAAAEAQSFVASLRSTAATAIGNYDRSLNNAELNMIGVNNRSFGDLVDALGRTATGDAVIEAGMGAFLEATFGSEEFDAFVARAKSEEAVKQALARRSGISFIPNAPGMRPIPMTMVRPRAQTHEWLSATSQSQFDGGVPATPAVPSRAVGLQPGQDDHSARMVDAATQSVELPRFLGVPDRSYAQRQPSKVKLFSVAAAEYLAKREQDRGLPAGATLPKSDREASPALNGLKHEPNKTRDLTTLRRAPRYSWN
ncbi:MAG: hypothetical protein HC788_10480 [Sphingopyxis sp.]|nr:hypothetical protein [Sphingopyxis sp.]